MRQWECLLLKFSKFQIICILVEQLQINELMLCDPRLVLIWRKFPKRRHSFDAISKICGCDFVTIWVWFFAKHRWVCFWDLKLWSSINFMIVKTLNFPRFKFTFMCALLIYPLVVEEKFIFSVDHYKNWDNPVQYESLGTLISPLNLKPAEKLGFTPKFLWITFFTFS